MDIAGARTLVTGAAGGLGDAISRELAARGAAVTASGRNREALERLANQVAGDVEICDLTDHAAVDALAARAGEWDLLIANAGTGGDRDLGAVDEAHIDEMIDINLRAPIVLATGFAQQHLVSGRPGHIVLIGSLSGLITTPNTRMYNATKFGLRGFGLSLRHDLAGSPVSVSIVEPGFIRDAGMFARGGMELPPGVRTNTPQQVAQAVVRAIERNRGEVFVAPVEMRALATFSGAAPGVAEWVQRRLGVAERKPGAQEPEA